MMRWKIVISNACDEQEYIDRVDMLMRSRKRRVECGELLRKRLRTEHVGEGWLHRLTTIYAGTDRLTHHPRRLPESSYIATDADINLSLWHAMADGQTYGTGDWKVTLHRHSASIAKYAGDHYKARQQAWRALLLPLGMTEPLGVCLQVPSSVSRPGPLFANNSHISPLFSPAL